MTLSYSTPRCEVTFPRAPEAGTQESSYDLRIGGATASGYEQHYQHGGEYGQHGGDHGQQSGHVEVTVEPTEVTLARGERATITCRVRGADQYKVTWGQYAHDTSLPSFARVRTIVFFLTNHCSYPFFVYSKKETMS